MRGSLLKMLHSVESYSDLKVLKNEELLEQNFTVLTILMAKSHNPGVMSLKTSRLIASNIFIRFSLSFVDRFLNFKFLTLIYHLLSVFYRPDILFYIPCNWRRFFIDEIVKRVQKYPYLTCSRVSFFISKWLYDFIILFQFKITF